MPSRFLLAALLGLALCPAASAARPLLTGFLDPGASATQRPDLMLSADDASARVSAAGASLVRLYLYWNRVATAEPTDPADPADPAYDWSLVDEQVTGAAAHGLTPVLDFRSAPLWAQAPGGDARGTLDPDAGALAAFAAAAAERYKGLVRYWEIWNEPNSPAFLRPQRDAEGRSVAPRLYRQLVNAAARSLHETDPTNVVVVGETAPRAGASGHSPLEFLRKLLCLSSGPEPEPVCSATVEADVFSHHPYSFGGPSRRALGADDVFLADLSKWRRLVRAAVRAGHVVDHAGLPKTHVPLWMSELSWDTSPPDPKGVPSRLHARWTAEALYLSWRAGASVLIWGQLRDYPLNADPLWGYYQSGFYTYDDRRKRSLAAFRFPFVAYARGGQISVWGRLPGGASGTVVVERRTDAGWRRVQTVETGSTGIFAARWSSPRSRGLLRARAGADVSVPFSLRRPADLFVRPFGCGGVVPC